MGQKSVDVIRVKQQNNFPCVDKPELELTELLHLRAGAEGGVGATGLEVDLTTFLIKRCKQMSKNKMAEGVTLPVTCWFFDKWISVSIRCFPAEAAHPVGPVLKTHSILPTEQNQTEPRVETEALHDRQ